jgi:Pterin binding enzyme/FG-GAP-like repeat
VGAESTRPGSERLPEAEELRRLIPVLKRLSGKLSIPISVDTYKSGVAEKALNIMASKSSTIRILEDMGDGKADVILYNPTNGNAATGIGTGSGFTFTPFIFSPGFTSVRLADCTGDGKADLTVYNKVNAAAYFGTGTGTGTFNFQSLFWSPGYDIVAPEDVNGDGKADVVLYNSATGTEYTGLSNGNGTFNYTYWYWGIGKVLAR